MFWSKYTYVYFNYADFTSSYEPFSQALKSFDYVLSGSKGKIAWRRKMQTKQQLKRCTQNVHSSFADFQSDFHIFLTQSWLGESSLSLLSLWCILFWIKLGLFRENLNLKKHLQPKNGWSSPSTFRHRLIYIVGDQLKPHNSIFPSFFLFLHFWVPNLFIHLWKPRNTRENIFGWNWG